MPLTISTLPLSAVVKETTQPVHAEVENLLLPVLSSIRHVKDYTAILKMFYGYFHPLENKILEQLGPEQLPDIGERRKAGAILHDLEQLSFPVTNLSECQQLPEITTPAQAFGALYVLEGSTLGGKMIAKMLLKNQSMSWNENALCFFSGYKEETGSRWKTFLEIFNRQENKAEVVNAARETFFYLKRWMQLTLNHDQE